jgi:enamine deaminase RidA (YjgF/YER057c/UK114 family)
MQIVNPPDLERPRGFSHGIVAPAGRRVLFVAGQTAAGASSDIAHIEFVSQFNEALRRVLHIVRSAGGSADTITRMTIYVTDMEMYRASRVRLAAVWAEHMGRHFPAMALVQVTALVDVGATVEIQADAVLP